MCQTFLFFLSGPDGEDCAPRKKGQGKREKKEGEEEGEEGEDEEQRSSGKGKGRIIRRRILTKMILEV